MLHLIDCLPILREEVHAKRKGWLVALGCITGHCSFINHNTHILVQQCCRYLSEAL